MRKLRVGVTIGLHSATETLWNNGIKQNAVFLAEALRHCSNVSRAVLVNTTSVAVTRQLPWDLDRWPTAGFDDVKDDLDVLIELGGQIDADRTDYLKRRGARVVSYCCGFEYVHAMEAVLFGKPMWGENLFVNQRYDDVWMVPQVANISQPFFEVLRRQTAHVVPFVWSPVFLDARTRDMERGGAYAPRQGPRRLTVMEPNIDVVKFCLYPVLIAELAYRERPDDVARLLVTNAEQIAKHNVDFIALMNQLDIVRDHKAVFLGRHETPAFLAEHTDIVISHQWENPLNYFYLEVCWQGYPLVHNASLCPELGYYYPGNDVREGARRVLGVIDEHDRVASAYRDRQRRLIARYLPDDPDLVAAYGALLDDLFLRPVR